MLKYFPILRSDVLAQDPASPGAHLAQLEWACFIRCKRLLSGILDAAQIRRLFRLKPPMMGIDKQRRKKGYQGHE
jgi:hypothetical protein